MDEAYGRRIARRQDSSFADTIQAVVGHTHGLVDRIGGIPVPRIIAASAPGYLVTCGQLLVERPNPDPLDTAQLFDAAPLRRFIPKAKTVHGPDDLQAQIVRQGKPGLIQKSVRPRTAGLPGRVQAHAALSDPEQQGPAVRSQGHGRMCDRGPRLQQQAGYPAQRYLHPHASGIHQHQGAVFHIQTATTQKQHGAALPDGNDLRIKTHPRLRDPDAPCAGQRHVPKKQSSTACLPRCPYPQQRKAHPGSAGTRPDLPGHRPR